MSTKPLIVGIGGTVRPDSSSERVLRACLRILADAGAQTMIFSGSSLIMPPYDVTCSTRTAAAVQMIDALRGSDGVVISSPGYHGSLSGVLKNAIDYAEDLREDERPYLDGRAVACIVCAQGPQASVNTLAALRSIVHALRGWPTPMGAALYSSTVFDSEGRFADPAVSQQMHIMCMQLLTFARFIRLQRSTECLASS
jgi:FMN reductase